MGKTTLAQRLSGELGISLISERARVVAQRMGISSTNALLTDRKLARKFQIALLSEQIHAESQLDSFITDRTTLDCLAYWRLYGLDQGSAYANRCMIRPYLIIYVPPVHPIQSDGFRLDGEENRIRVDLIIREILDQYPGPIIYSTSLRHETLITEIISWSKS